MLRPAWPIWTALVLSLFQSFAVFADDDADALKLESAPTDTVTTSSAGGLKIFAEGVVGSSSQRYLRSRQDIGRASVDVTFSGRLAPGLRGVFSDRIDSIHPSGAGVDSVINSLREAYVSWQPGDGNTIVEFGRVNLRYGPAYGYNPTDFFRDGSLRTLTSANPFALRENRLGTGILRAQRLWSGGSLSVALSPKLATRPSADGWSLDLGATNNRDRMLLALGTQFSDRVNTQLLAYKDEDLSTAWGASLTALLSDAATGHVEWSRGKEPDLLSRALSVPAVAVARNRFAGGFTYTTLGKLSVTIEYQYNGFALNKSNWRSLGAASPLSQIAYLQDALRRQELASREAFFVYVTQKELFVKDLDLTAFLRINTSDRSRMVWVELRHHWPRFDLAVQLQGNIGRITSEFGILPDRRVFQVLGTYYF